MSKAKVQTLTEKLKEIEAKVDAAGKKADSHLAQYEDAMRDYNWFRSQQIQIELEIRLNKDVPQKTKE